MSEEIEIMDHFIAAIQAGKYEPNDKLPSENELADRLKVPRMTARRAYERLQELGYIYSMQGKGSFVKDRQQQIPLILSNAKSFSQKMVELGFNYLSRNVLCEKVGFNPQIFALLGVSEHDAVYRIDRLRIINDQPIALHSSYVPEALFPDIRHAGKEIKSMFQYYNSKGYTEFQSDGTRLSVTYPGRHERELLDCPILVPLLVLESSCADKASGRMLEYSRTLYRGDSFTYVIGNNH
ncbi:GntR family transcriptional regulator [Paenibacillus jiagnxiensis]|uniref:GntR family transcriptional regulator n=1 Tax=Paenibacillus jiagnxiensis TaxID=3228926 RepID=UPI0033A2A328